MVRQEHMRARAIDEPGGTGDMTDRQRTLEAIRMLADEGVDPRQGRSLISVERLMPFK